MLSSLWLKVKLNLQTKTLFCMASKHKKWPSLRILSVPVLDDQVAVKGSFGALADDSI